MTKRQPNLSRHSGMGAERFTDHLLRRIRLGPACSPLMLGEQVGAVRGVWMRQVTLLNPER